MALSVVSKMALRDDIKAYFLRDITTILTYINMKMDKYSNCKLEKDFDVTILEKGMKAVDDILKK